MAFFPITYFMFIIWIIMLYTFDSWTLKTLGASLGMFIGLKTIGGETWLNVDASSNYTLVTQASGFQLYLGLAIFTLSLVNLIALSFYMIDQRRKGVKWREVLTI